MKATFNKLTRYSTSGIVTEMPPSLQAFLWQSIDDWNAEDFPLDYLQVFKFKKVADGLYAIEHTQEEPERTIVYYVGGDLEVESVVGKTVFVIDDGDHSTMLFSSEY